MKTYTREEVITYLQLFDNIMNNGINKLTVDQTKEWLDLVDDTLIEFSKNKLAE